MDTLTQGIIWWALFTLTTKKYTIKHFILWWLIANIPDLDVFIGPLVHSHPIDQFFFHRWITHSLIWWWVISLLVGFILSVIEGRRGFQDIVRTLCASFLAIFGGHLVIDRLTSYGMRWWLPRSGVTSSFDTIFIIDLGMWALLLILFIWYCLSHRRALASLSIVVGAGAYIALCVFFKSIASNQIIDHFNQQFPAQKMISSITMPEPLQPFLRRGLIKTSSGYYQWRYSIFDKPSEDVTFQIKPLWIDHTTLLSTVTWDENDRLQKILSFARWYDLISSWASWYSIDNLIFGSFNGWDETASKERMFSFELIDHKLIRAEDWSRRSFSSINWNLFWLRVRGKHASIVPNK